MTMGDRIKYLRIKKGVTQEDLGRIIGVQRSAIRKYEHGEVENIPRSSIQKMAEFLGVTPSYLMGFDDVTTCDSVASTIEAHKQAILSRVPLLDTPVSAGQGTWVDEGYEYAYVDFDDAPHGTDFALRVRGDSMTPLYNNDDIVFVKQNIIVESGQIGVFVLNNEGYMKMLQGNRLISLNPEYEPIIINEWDTFFCAGRVIGKTIKK